MILTKFDFESLKTYFHELVDYIWFEKKAKSRVMIILIDTSVSEITVLSNLDGSGRLNLLAMVFNREAEKRAELEASLETDDQKDRV